MSFLDVVRSTPSRSLSNIPRSQSSISENASTAAILDTLNTNDGSNGEFYSLDIREVSDEVLQYQKEVGRLPSALHAATTAILDSSDEWKLKLQFSEVRKLGEQISLHLSTCEENLKVVQRHKAADSRAAILKLTRDFRRVETIFKNLEMDLKRKCADRSKLVYSYETHSRLHHDQRRNDEETRELQMQVEEQDRLNQEIMRLREAEVLEINRKMHQVNEIYKDLGELVTNQQEQIDQVEIEMEAAAINTRSGLTQLEAANKNNERSFTNPFKKVLNDKKSVDSDQTPSYVSSPAASDGCSWSSPLESLIIGFQQISEEMNTLQRKLTIVFTLGNGRCCPPK